MANFNKVMLMGNMTRDPELRYLPSNMAVVSFGLAINDRWKDKNSGEWQERANFFDCEAFGRGAEIINQYMTKGRPIFIEGKLRMDTWDDKQTGQKRSKIKIVVDNFQFIGGQEEGQRSSGTPPCGAAAQSTSNQYAGGGHEPIDEDDIPL